MSAMTLVSGFQEVYGEMFAGRVPNHSDDPYQSVVLWAQDTLNTDKVHIGMQKSGEWAYYFAARSINFASVGVFATPLVAAIPGHPAHRGDGAYVLTQGGLSVAAVFSNQTLKLFCNDTKLIEEKLADMEVQVFYIDDSVPQPLMIESIRGRFRRLADRFSQQTIKYSAIVAVLSFTIAILASFAETALSSSLKNANEKSAEELNALVNRIEYSSPLAQQVGQLNKISATVVRAGGWIEEYRLKGEKETFVISLPEWVTQDYIVAMGKGAVADHDTVNNLIRVIKK